MIFYNKSTWVAVTFLVSLPALAPAAKAETFALAFSGVRSHETTSGQDNKGVQLRLTLPSEQCAGADGTPPTWEASGSAGVVWGDGGNQAIGSAVIDTPLTLKRSQCQQLQQQAGPGGPKLNGWNTLRILPTSATAHTVRADLAGLGRNYRSEDSSRYRNYRVGARTLGAQRDRVGEGASAFRPVTIEANADIANLDNGTALEANLAASLLLSGQGVGHDLTGQVLVRYAPNGGYKFLSLGVSGEKTKYLSATGEDIDTQAITGMVTAGIGI